MKCALHYRLAALQHIPCLYSAFHGNSTSLQHRPTYLNDILISLSVSVMCVVYFVPSSSLSVLIYVCRCLPISFFGFILLPTTEVTHTSNFTASTQHHPPTRSLSGGHTADNFMHSQTLPSQKLFLGEVSYNLPPHSAANSRCAVDVYFDAEQKGKKSIKKKERKMVL